MPESNGRGPVDPASRPTLGERLKQAFAAPPPPDPKAPKGSTRWAVDRIDAREKRFTVAAAVLSVAFGITVYIAEAHNPHFHRTKNQLSPETMLIIGLIAGACLIGSVFVGRRALVGFVAGMTGIAFLSYGVTGFLFIIFAGWLLWRSWKVQRSAATEARASPGAGRATSGGRAQAGTARDAPRATAGRSRKKGKGPEPNKRYTPKRPGVPKPEPTWRQRKGFDNT